MPPAAMPSSVRKPMCRAWAASGPPRRGLPKAELDEGRAGELRRRSEAAPFRIESRCEALDHLLEQDFRVEPDCGRGAPAKRSRGRRRPAAAASARLLAQRLRQPELPPHRADECIGLLEHLCPLVGPGVAQRLHHPAEGRHAVALHRWEVGPGVEGAPVGRAEDRHGPASRPREGLGGRHIDRIEIGALLTVDLDRNEGLASSAAVSGSSKLSWAMTWHQWHEAYPMDTKRGLSSSRARCRASSPQGNHSTGLSACWRRYGLVSSARWFTGAMLRLLPPGAAHGGAVQGSGDGARTQRKDGTDHRREPWHRPGPGRPLRRSRCQRHDRVAQGG